MVHLRGAREQHLKNIDVDISRNTLAVVTYGTRHDGRCGVEFFADEPLVCRLLRSLREVGLGFLRQAQPATQPPMPSGSAASSSEWWD